MMFTLVYSVFIQPWKMLLCYYIRSALWLGRSVITRMCDERFKIRSYDRRVLDSYNVNNEKVC